MAPHLRVASWLGDSARQLERRRIGGVQVGTVRITAATGNVRLRIGGTVARTMSQRR